MKAILLDGKKNVEVIEKSVPDLLEGYALIKVMAAGICGTDIEMLYHNPVPSVITPGHEVSGIIEKVNHCKTFKAGDRVFLNCHITCNTCEYCLAGDYIFCEELSVIGFDVDGGMAEYIAVPETILRRLPDDLTFEQGVLITDALGTPYHAVKKAEIKKGEIVCISGTGPLGILCILSAVHFGAIVIAIDIVEERLKMAERFGATYLVNGMSNIKERINEITNGKGVDKVIDCSGSAIAILNDIGILKNRGVMIQVGVCNKITMDLFETLIVKEIEIKGSRNFNDFEIPEMIDLIRNTERIDELISHRFLFSEAEQAFQLAEERKGIKIVLVPELI
jgi:threonine dehydrogenase-like Zn-dependent dehydrogenase